MHHLRREEPDAAKLSVIIITLNEEANIGKLLDDLAHQTRRDFETIIVDSASTDRTVELAAGFGDRLTLNIIEMNKRGASLGRNRGAEAADTERLLFLDADTRIAPDFVAKALWSLDMANVDVGAVLMAANGGSWRAWLGYAVMNVGIRASAAFFPTAVGACLFSTRRAHRLIGGFDESVTLCEDCDYALAAHQHEQLKFGVLPVRFAFNPRRLEQDGYLSTGLTYLRANIYRFFKGRLTGNPYGYTFGHYEKRNA